MYNEDFNILHLSDLHIRKEGTTYSNELKYLIKDIKKQTQNRGNIIIVISGDIIDQGNYGVHKDAAIKFFEELKGSIQKVKDIIIVPGNHDKARSRINTLISMSHMNVGIDAQSDQSQIEWDKQLEAYKDYFIFVNEIYRIFEKDKCIDNTFGVDVIKFDSFNICFIRLDSAWSSYSEDDHRKLRLSDFQLEKLQNEYKTKRTEIADNDESGIDLTIAVSHYPLNWLNIHEEEKCNNYLLSADSLDVDVLMCGHVHDFSVVNYFNHQHSLMTLVTGIGDVKKEMTGNHHVNNHRYSLYSMNLFYNSCEIIMRKSKSNNEYDFDYSVYTGQYEQENRKLRYPLKVKESNAFIILNSLEPLNEKSLFVDNKLLEQIPTVTNAIASLSESIARLYGRYIDNFFEGFIEKWIPNYDKYNPENEKNETLTKIKRYLYQGVDLPDTYKKEYFELNTSYADFLAFLQEICEKIICELKICFSEEVNMRAHFRWHDETNDNYPMLCRKFSEGCASQEKVEMQTIEWGGLIKLAFETRKPIIFSANKQYNQTETKWEDFMTLIPQFNNFSHDVRLKKGRNETRPIFSFGLSIEKIKAKEDAISLYLLSFLGVDKILTQAIDEYIRLFNIDAKSILFKIQNIKADKDKQEV